MLKHGVCDMIIHPVMGIHTWLVVSTPLKNISQLGSLFPIYGKMFQTTNQIHNGYIKPSSWIDEECGAGSICLRAAHRSRQTSGSLFKR
jgi:hypothetical protein